MTLSKAEQARRLEEKEQAIVRLRDIYKPGDTVTTVIRHVSRSGMSRSISVLGPDVEDFVEDLSYLVARALGDKVDQKNGGVIVGGCGIDMGFHLVYSLSRTIYPVYNCTGKSEWPNRCPSNEHVNKGPNRDNYGVGNAHSDGYALRQRWL